MAGDVDDFADEVEAWNIATFHGLGGEGVGADASRGDFCLVVAFGVCGGEGPCVEAAIELVQGVIGPVRRWGGFEEALGEAGWEAHSERGFGGVEVAAGAGFAEGGEEVLVGGPVDFDWLRTVPVGGDLEDGGTAESAMREEQLFSEASLADGRYDFGGDSGQVAERRLLGGAEDKGDEGWAGFADGDVELAGYVVAETGSAHFGDGEASGGYDQVGGLVGGGVGDDDEAGSFLWIAVDFLDLRFEDDFDIGFGGFAEEHGDDLLGGVVAEELAQGFLVVLNAVAFDEGDEVGGRVAGERGFGEVGIGGEEVVGAGEEVGEVRAASAGDEDFFADAVGAFEEEDAAAALAGFDGAHQAGCACACNYDVEGCLDGGSGHRRRGTLVLLEHRDFKGNSFFADRSPSSFSTLCEASGMVRRGCFS